ncbi:hypothetical protein SY89_00082 [Halolamina pelagica]|uniref:Uncharacterized protein n=1 Tax=Halolamina pelagica TaxID=699431 RepID=A0A0P7GL66_9EURY|nr:hypothetical protein [Halolamina pelagica]KPN29369.1 hypothetical protein SY89_00082 [Halolamina pelagica]
MSRQTRRSLLAAVGTALTGALAGCGDLNPLSEETPVEYDDDAIAALAGDIPEIPPAVPVQPTDEHVETARERIRTLLADTDLSRIPNAVVRDVLAREREVARDALSEDEGEHRIDVLPGLTHPRSEAMFVDAGLAAFDDELTAAGVESRRERHHRDAASFLDDYSPVGPAADPVAAFAEHARITDWARTGARLTEPATHHEYENTVLHVAELAQRLEWGRAYAADARRLHDHYVSTLEEPHDYAERFASVAASLVGDVEAHATPPDWDELASDLERDVSETPAERLLEELARSRWIGAQSAVEHHEAGEPVGAILPAMRALAADRAFADARDAVSNGAYGVPESVTPIEDERAAAVEGLRSVLDTAPALLARRLAQYAYSPIRNADRSVTDGTITADGRDLYAQYAVANRFAAAAPAVVQRVGSALQG